MISNFRDECNKAPATACYRFSRDELLGILNEERDIALATQTRELAEARRALAAAKGLVEKWDAISKNPVYDRPTQIGYAFRRDELKDALGLASQSMPSTPSVD